MSKKNIDMCNGPIFSNIIAFTVPIILSSLLQLMFNAVDLIVVGRFCGSESVAAVGSTGSLTALAVNFFIGLSIGVGVVVAQGLGARNYKKVHDAVHTSIPIAAISGIIIAIVGVLISKKALEWMGTPAGSLLDLSSVYLRIYFLGVPFSLIYNFGAAILRATGDTKNPLKYLTIAGIANAILNLIFVIVFKLNVMGVAIATSVSQFISAALVMYALIARQDVCKFYIKEICIEKESLISILKVGVPSGIQSSLFAISNVIIQSSVNSLGPEMMSGSAAAANIEGFNYVIMNAFSQTAVNFNGQNYGAGNIRRTKKITGACLLLVTTIGLIGGNLFFIFGKQLLGIYITDSELAIQLGLARLKYILCPHFLCGIMDVMTGSLRGLGVSFIPMVITVVGACLLRIVWIFTVFAQPQFHNIDWLFVSYPISWFLTFAAELTAFLIVVSKFSKQMKKA